jgi:hypothetical protein
MNDEDIVSAGDAPPLLRVTVVALYDQRDGRIGHLHQVYSFAGSTDSSEEDAVAAAHENARRLGYEEAGWRAAISHDPEHGRRACSVDLTTGAFTFRDNTDATNRDLRHSG